VIERDPRAEDRQAERGGEKPVGWAGARRSRELAIVAPEEGDERRGNARAADGADAERQQRDERPEGRDAR